MRWRWWRRGKRREDESRDDERYREALRKRAELRRRVAELKVRVEAIERG